MTKKTGAHGGHANNGVSSSGYRSPFPHLTSKQSTNARIQAVIARTNGTMLSNVIAHQLGRRGRNDKNFMHSWRTFKKFVSAIRNPKTRQTGTRRMVAQVRRRTRVDIDGWGSHQIVVEVLVHLVCSTGGDTSSASIGVGWVVLCARVSVALGAGASISDGLFGGGCNSVVVFDTSLKLECTTHSIDVVRMRPSRVRTTVFWVTFCCCRSW